MNSTLDLMQAAADDDGVGPYPIDLRDFPPPSSETAREASKSGKKKGKSKKKKKTVDASDSVADDELFRVISNPQKMLPNPRKKTGKDEKKKKKGKGSVNSMSSFSGYSSENSRMSSMGIGSFGSQNSQMGGMGYGGEGSFASQESGSLNNDRQAGNKKRREDIMQEKIEMLTRISKMSKQGFTTTKRWGMRDDIDEIRFECYRMTRENNSKKAVKNMQHALITMATILEFANNMINPFNLKLQGFSKNMMLTVSDYDDSLEAIHHKWSGRTSIGPELTVLFTFATSAVFHHAGNVSSTKDTATSRQQEDKPKPGGGMGLGDMSSMLGMFSNLMPKAAPAQPAREKDASIDVAEETKKRRPMKGPSLPGASMKLPE